MGTAFSSFLIASRKSTATPGPGGERRDGRPRGRAANAYACGARMDHNFAGHAYTIGIEEELMIVDGRSLDLVNAIEAMLEPAPLGEIKPELMESVLEISTDPCATVPEAGEQLRALRRQVCATAQLQGDGDRLGRHPPVRDVGGPADRRPPALPRPDLGVAVRRPPGADLRDARPRRRRRPRQGDPRRQRDARPPAGAARACRPTRRSGAPPRPAWRRRGRRSSASSRGSGSRRRTPTGTTTRARSSS